MAAIIPLGICASVLLAALCLPTRKSFSGPLALLATAFSALAIIFFTGLTEGMGTQDSLRSWVGYAASLDWVSDHTAIAFAFLIVLFVLLIYMLSDSHPIINRASLLYCLSSACLTLFSEPSEMALTFLEISSIFALILMRDPRGRNLHSLLHYALVHFLTGGCLMAFIAINNQGDYNYDYLVEIALLVNCALFPFATTLIEPYLGAGPDKTMILQAYSSKASIFMLSLMLSGHQELIVIGTLTCVYAIVFLLIEDNIIKFLLYNTVGQLGLLAFGIGEGAYIVPHIVSSLIYQTALFMCAHSVICATQKRRFSQISGLGKLMPITLIVSILACASMGSLPLSPGFYSKIVIAQSLSHHHLFSLLSYGLFTACGMKFVICLFTGQKSEGEVAELPRTRKLGLIAIGALCTIALFNPIDLVGSLAENATSYGVNFALSLLVFLLVRNRLRFIESQDLDRLYFAASRYVACKLASFKQVAIAAFDNGCRGFAKRVHDTYQDHRNYLSEVEELDYATYFAILLFVIIFILS